MKPTFSESTRRGPQRYLQARFFIRRFAVVTAAGAGQAPTQARRAVPVGSATRGYETGTVWR